MKKHRGQNSRLLFALTLCLAMSLVAASGGALLGRARAGAAPSPNLLVNGGFEDPVTLTGQSAPPFGSCGASVVIAGASAGIGCWTFVNGPSGSAWVDRANHKAGKQSLSFHGPASTYVQLWQPVAAGPGTYRLEFQATSDDNPSYPLVGSCPMYVLLDSVAAGDATDGAQVRFGPTYQVSNVTSTHAWTKYTLDFTAPPGTDHLLVEIYSNGLEGAVAARLDAMTLKQIG